MEHSQAMRAAVALTTARRTGVRIDALPDGAVPQSHEDAYQIQDCVVACYGERVGAWKVGATHPAAQEKLGVPGPVAARLFEPRIVHSNHHRLPDTFMVRGLEAEYAFCMSKDLPPRETAYSRDEVEDAIASVHPAIEIVDTRFSTLQQGALTISDGVNDAYWVYGDGKSDWRSLDIIKAPVNMEVNGEVVVEGNGEQVLGDPIVSLMWLVNEHAQHREGLRAGQYVTAGSCTGLYPSPQHCTARATFEGLGEVVVEFVKA